MDYNAFYQTLEATPLAPWLQTLPRRVNGALLESPHGDWPRWQEILRRLPPLKPSSVDLNAGAVRIGDAGDCDADTRQVLEQLLRQLHPWRKGPYCVFGIPIHTEWRSDWKWERLCRHIQPLRDRLVLDVGCGNGYHCWRMAGAGAKLVIGIDPYLLFVAQFQSLHRYTAHPNVQILPLGIEDIPKDLEGFDSVFSMGVLYHRRSPMDHLLELRSCLRRGGELILETLVIEGGPRESLVPPGRYAKMRNVWFLPSCSTLESWLKRCGFADVRLVHECRTTTEEQRSTDWMTFESLQDYLDPKHPHLTVEGLPAPRRAIFLATKP